MSEINENMNLEDGASPFAPPEAYSPPKIDDEIPYEEMNPFLQTLIDEHKAFTIAVNDFEDTLLLIEGGRVDREIDVKLRKFFAYYDEEIREHNFKEEKTLFPIVSQMMDKDGTHSKGSDDFNAIDVLEDEHSNFIQLSAVVFNLFALFSRIPDETSRMIILDAAVAEAKALVEMLKIHIYREDTIIFNYAQRNLTDEDFLQIQSNVRVKNKGEEYVHQH